MSTFDAVFKSHKGHFLQVWHALQRRKPRNKCPILKGCFPSSFESKGRGLPAGLQSSPKAVRHAYLRICISSSSWVLLVCSCIPTQILACHEVDRKNSQACNGIDVDIAEILKSPIAGYDGTRLKDDSSSHAQESASIIFRLVWNPTKSSKTAGALPRLCAREM